VFQDNFQIIQFKNFQKQLLSQKGFTKYHLINKDHQIDKEATRKYIQEVAKDYAKYSEIIENATDYCFNFTEQHGAEIQKFHKIDIEKCNYNFNTFENCHLMMVVYKVILSFLRCF
jgi:hypothetical protein